MFRYFNVINNGNKKDYIEKVVFQDFSTIKTLNNLKNEMSGMTETEKTIFAKMFFDRLDKIGGIK